jgi:small subunit ribosomal protein S8
MTDGVADMLARIKNGQVAKLQAVAVPHSNLKKGVLQVIKDSGYIKSFEEQKSTKTGHKEFIVHLKYMQGRKPVIQDLKKVSKPGCRRYSPIGELKSFYNNLGTTILSTSKGILSDKQARAANVGGEVLCQIF